MNDESQTHPLPEMDEQRFRALIENSSDGMALVDAEGRILYSSPSVSRLLGYSVEEFVGRNAFEFIHPDDHAHTGAVLANLVQQPRQSASAQYRIRHKDGAWRWNEATGTNLLDEPTVRALVVNYRDITGRKQAEAALQESYALLQTVIESIGDAVYVKDQQGRYRFINTAGARVFDKTTAEVKGQDDRALFVPEDARRIITNDRTIMASGLTQTFEETVTVLGGVRTYLTTKGPYLDATGAVAGLIGISRDITEYKQADEALQESEIRLRALLESAPVGILVTDGAGRILQANARVEELFGYAQAELFGKSVEVLLPERFRATHVRHRTHYLSDLSNRAMGLGRDLAGQRKDGSEFPVEVGLSAVQVRDEIFITAFITDITARRKAEIALQQTNLELVARVNELHQRNREITLLNDMGDLLQACRTAEDAYEVVASSARQLFPGDSGVLFVFSASRNFLEAVATWDGITLRNGAAVFPADACWALRRGRAHCVEDTAHGLLCQHLSQPWPVSYLCVPMLAQGELLGLLHLRSRASAPASAGGFTEAKQQLATTVAEHIGLALSNLNLRESLRAQSIRDPLTGLFNRRYMEESLERELRRAARNHRPLGILMLDLDHFKQFNDAFGHAVGDVLLRELGTFLKTHIRGEDIACRYGGEEFTLILPDTSLEDSRQRAEQLREAVQHLHLPQPHQHSAISLSVGVASFPEHGMTIEALLNAADAALYRAKAEGRNRVVVAPNPDSQFKRSAS